MPGLAGLALSHAGVEAPEAQMPMSHGPVCSSEGFAYWARRRGVAPSLDLVLEHLCKGNPGPQNGTQQPTMEGLVRWAHDSQGPM